MGKETTIETRIKIMELAKAKYTDKQIAQEVGLAIPTVRKWRRRGQKQGRAGLVSTMGRPVTGAMGSFPETMRADIHLRRVEHPGWGPDTLLGEIEREEYWQGQQYPSRATVARYLKEQGLTREYERQSQLPQEKRQAAKEPHDVWEVDARGEEYIPDVGVVALVNIKDRCSRARLLSFPAVLGHRRRRRHPNTEDYQSALRLAFTDWGLPNQVQVDHASVFFDNTTKSPFPTRMHLWLTALGIDVCFSRRHRPTDQAGVERSHQLWAAQVLAGQSFSSWESLFLALQKRRDFLNTALPCASLDGLPPLLAFPQASHSGRYYRPEWEADLLDLDRVFTYLRRGRWFRKVSKNGTLTLGRNIMSVGVQLAGKQLEVKMDPEKTNLVCFNSQGDIVAECQPTNLTKEYLMGHLATSFNLPFFQLALPFSDEAQQVIRLFETMGVTT